MWKTSQGDRILEGWEAELIRKILAHIHEQFESGAVDPDLGLFTGVAIFDELRGNQQLAMLLHIGESLLESPETPELSAVREATIYALFQCLRLAISDEIKKEEFTGAHCREWRELALATRTDIDRRHGYEDDMLEIPQLGSADHDEWESLTEYLADEILCDRDFEMGYLVEDEEPENAQILKQILDIGDNYYTDVSPDPRDEEMGSIYQRLSRICTKPR